MIKKPSFLLSLLLSCLLGFTAISHAASDKTDQIIDTFEPLTPDQSQRKASIQIAKSLTIRHYRKQILNRNLSNRVFENYLDTLDSQRLYLLKSDVEEFEPYRYQLQAALKTAQLEPGFAIYNRYLERVIDRIQKQLALLKNDKQRFDFSKDEYILTDRQDLDWAESEAELDDVWRRRIKSAILSDTLAGKSVEKAKEELIKRYENQLNRNLQVRSEDAFQVYMNAFTTVYDPHTNYFSPRSSENFNINMRLSLEGIGAVLQSDNEYTKVVRLVPGGPAQSQGQLKPADRIVGVAQGDDGEMVNVVGWRLDEVVELIRGPKKSTVRLEVIAAESKLDTDTKQISIVRDKVKLEDQAASSNLIQIDRDGQNKRIGVIDIPTFYADFQALQRGDPNYKSTTRDVVNLIDELEKESKLDGLVIDLRGNGGGSLDEANRLTGLFIHRGPTVQIRGTRNNVDVMEDPDPSLVYGGPLMVLVDRLSASASEIFAGAIQDYGRGIVMGSQTFGKGTVQSVQPLDHGQLKITQAKFYRISGASTQHKGVIPDILVPETVDKTKVGEDSLENALAWDAIESARFKNLDFVSGVLDELTSKHQARFTQQEEYKLLLEEIDLLETQRNKNKVSLNKKKRQQERKDLDRIQLGLINKRRQIKGESTFKTIEEWEDYQDEQASQPESDEEPDFVVKESAEVLLDFIDLKTPMTANAA